MTRRTDPKSKAPTQVPNVKVNNVSATGRSIVIEKPDGEEYRVALSQVLPGSIRHKGEAGALIVPKWIAERFVPGSESHVASYNQRQRTFTDADLEDDLEQAGLGPDPPTSGSGVMPPPVNPQDPVLLNVAAVERIARALERLSDGLVSLGALWLASTQTFANEGRIREQAVERLMRIMK
jgi:hypothetical protein